MYYVYFPSEHETNIASWLFWCPVSGSFSWLLKNIFPLKFFIVSDGCSVGSSGQKSLCANCASEINFASCWEIWEWTRQTHKEIYG